MKRDKHLRPTPDQSHRDIPALRFWDTIDREQFELALSENDKYAAFLGALHDPNYSRCSFPTLLRKFNISLHEAQALYTDHMRYQGLLRMSSQLPQVMADVAEDAKSRMRVCPRCDGEKVVEPTRGNKRGRRVCPDCKGTGEIRMIGDRHARDLVFESMKLTGQKGPLVSINQDFRSGGTDPSLDMRMETLLKMSQRIVLGAHDSDQGERRSMEPTATDDVTPSSSPTPE